MNYYVVEPEVAGGLGENTAMDRTVHPPIVNKLHYKFDGWLGDLLLESFPCFIAEKCVAQQLKVASLTGFDFSDVEITKSEQFKELYPNRQLPEFVWLKVFGKAGVDDFGVSDDSRLVVSERVLSYFKSQGLKNALVETFNP